MPGVGILGGTFDPVHNGHVRHAVEVAEALGLDRVFLMPCALPPHKARSVLPFGLRAAMLRAATKDAPCLAVTEIEKGLPVPSYTWQTLDAWRRLRPGEEAPFFMMGMESFLSLDSWFRWRELPGMASLVVVSRGGEDAARFRGRLPELWPGACVLSSRPCGAGAEGRVEKAGLPGGGTVCFVSVPRLDISSTDIRSRWLAGRPLCGLVHPGVEAMLDARRDEVRACWSRS